MWWFDWLIDWLKKFRSDIGFFELKILMFLMLKCFERRIATLLITVSNNYSVWWSALCEWPMMEKNDDDAEDPRRWCSWKKWNVYFWAIASRETKITTFKLITIRILELENNDDNVDWLMTIRGRKSRITMINEKINCSMRIINANVEKTSKIRCFDDIVMNEMIW